MSDTALQYSIRGYTSADLDAVAGLFRAYAASLNIDLSFQDFATELAELPGSYAAPAGILLVARDAASQDPLGCVGVRPLKSTSSTSSSTTPNELDTARACEMKRLYVSPAARGSGLGRELAKQAIAKARALGYTVMRLDTLSTMTAARRMYVTLGFRETAPYYTTPLKDTFFLELQLQPSVNGTDKSPN